MSRKKHLQKVSCMIAAIMVASCMAEVISFNPNSENMSIVAQAYSTGNYKVNTSSGLNVRNGAGTSYRINGAATNGTTFTVDQVSGNWGHTNSIKCTNGYKSGWVSLSYCTTVSSSTSSFTAGYYKVVNCSVLNVRTGPGTNYGVKTTTTSGKYHWITSKSGNWGYSSTVGGYVSMSYMQYSPSGASSTPDYKTPLSNGTTYFISPACATSNVLDASGAGTGNGTNIISWAKHSGTNQQFKAVLVSNGYYTFYNVNSGKVIDVSGGIVADGSNVQLYQYNGTAAQLWRLYEAGNGYYYLQSKLNSSYYLDVNGASSANGANVHLWKGNSTSAQKFRFTPIGGDVIPAANNGTAWKKDLNIWTAKKLNVTSTTSNRSATRYNAVINQYEVQTHTQGSGYRYAPYRKIDGKPYTYCNVFVLDVLSAMNAHPGKYMCCSPLLSWMNAGNGGWRKVSAYEAQQAANAGKPTIALTSDHTAIVRPEGNGYSYSSSKGPVIAQAGASVYNYCNVSTTWGSRRLSQVCYFTHA